ncbi:MAG: HAD-IB family hydrolase [Candidatus Saccharibacteria bacterium]|nr:HAD-IB family hydrolase [Candidatus Saccharibacteria bacterium]
MKKFAAYDIDGTLIRWQLYHVLVDKLASEGALGKDAKRLLREARMVWKRREHADAFKEYESTLIKIYENALHNISTKEFDKLVTGVIDEYKDQTYVYTRDMLRTLRSDGYFLIIISGSHHELIEQIGKYYGFDDWIGTRYLRDKGAFSGEKELASRDKASALRKLVEKHSLTYDGSVGIGDSKSDVAMLELVEKPTAFNPDELLLRRGAEA